MKILEDDLMKLDGFETVAGCRIYKCKNGGIYFLDPISRKNDSEPAYINLLELLEGISEKSYESGISSEKEKIKKNIQEKVFKFFEL
jgi:hypothetical protein